MFTYPLAVIGYFYEAYRSKFPSFKQKLEVFKILLMLSYRSKKSPSKDKIIYHSIFGFKVASYNYTMLLVLFREIFLSWDYHFPANKRNPKIIDCGANIGMSILFFKMLYPDCEIIAFEPSPDAFKLLKKNVEQNNLSNVTLFNIGLSDTEGTISFYTEQKGSLVGSIFQDRGGDNITQIECKKLSSFIKDQKYDLIKIDVEGAEWQILEDLQKSRCINCSHRYIIEYHHKIKNRESVLSKFLVAYENESYDYSLKSTFDNPAGFQDILLNIYRKEKEFAA